MFEAEGLVTVVNGPTVTVQNNESADFQITRLTSALTNNQNNNNTNNNNNNNNNFQTGQDRVDMQISPIISELG